MEESGITADDMLNVMLILFVIAWLIIGTLYIQTGKWEWVAFCYGMAAIKTCGYFWLNKEVHYTY